MPRERGQAQETSSPAVFRIPCVHLPAALLLNPKAAHLLLVDCLQVQEIQNLASSFGITFATTSTLFQAAAFQIHILTLAGTGDTQPGCLLWHHLHQSHQGGRHTGSTRLAPHKRRLRDQAQRGGCGGCG